MHRLFLACVIFCVPALIASGDDTADERREKYELMQLLVESFQQIESNYVTEVDRRELVDAAIQGMIEHLDQYSSYVPPDNVQQFRQAVEQEFGGIGIHVNMLRGELLVLSPLPGAPAYEAGVRPGDRIIAIDGESAEDITLSEAVKKIQGPAGRPVVLKVIHKGVDEPEEIAIVRQVIQVPSVLGTRLNADRQWDFMYSDAEKIGYVQVSRFGPRTPEELRTTMQQLLDSGMKGLVLDLRSNPGGLLDAAIEICDMFLTDGNIVSVKGRNVRDQSWDAKAADTLPDFPMAILVNRYSASASEVVSAALQDNERAIVVGERTWGKGSVQNVIRMEGGDSRLKLTMASYHRPSGVNIHRLRDAKDSDDWGVRPDEGFEFKFDDQQFGQWFASTRRREVMLEDETGNQTTDDSGTQPAFVDTQLNAALDHVRMKIAEKQVAESGPECYDVIRFRFLI